MHHNFKIGIKAAVTASFMAIAGLPYGRAVAQEAFSFPLQSHGVNIYAYNYDYAAKGAGDTAMHSVMTAKPQPIAAEPASSILPSPGACALAVIGIGMIATTRKRDRRR